MVASIIDKKLAFELPWLSQLDLETQRGCTACFKFAKERGIFGAEMNEFEELVGDPVEAASYLAILRKYGALVYDPRTQRYYEKDSLEKLRKMKEKRKRKEESSIYVPVEFKSRVGMHVGPDLCYYGPYEPGERAIIHKKLADWFTSKGLAEVVLDG